MLNNITVMGRIVRDPEKKYTQSKRAFTRFTVACERDAKGQNGEKETDFIECVAWQNTAEVVEKYFHKGDMIAVNGRLQSQRWTDKEGKPKVSWEIVVSSAYFSGGRQADVRKDTEGRDGNPHKGTNAAPAGYQGNVKGGNTRYARQNDEDYGSSFGNLQDADGELPF